MGNQFTTILNLNVVNVVMNVVKPVVIILSSVVVKGAVSLAVKDWEVVAKFYAVVVNVVSNVIANVVKILVVV